MIDDDCSPRFYKTMSWVFAVVCALNLCGNILNRHRKYIPSDQQVSATYIAPSRLEVTCKDLDENGSKETLLKIDDREYLLREEHGKPVLTAYELVPERKIPAKIIYDGEIRSTTLPVEKENVKEGK